MMDSDSNRDRAIYHLLAHCQRQVYAPKHIILTAGEPSEDLYYVMSGTVTVLIKGDKCEELVLAYLSAGEFFGEASMFEAHQNRSAFVRTKTKCEVARINYKAFKELSALFPELLFFIGRQMARYLRSTSRKVSDLAFVNVKGRVAKTLWELCRAPDSIPHPDGVQIKITRKELGRIVGCSREMAGRVLRELVEEQLITVSGKTILILGAR